MAVHPADYPHRVNKVVISGDCFSGSEIWSTGFYMGSETADAGDPGSLAALNIAPYWTTFFTHVDSHISNGYRTLQIKVSQLGTDGDTDLEMIDFYDYPSPPAGGGGASTLPPQISLAATLTSELQRGLAAKGRMYLPGINSAVSSSSAKLSTITTNPLLDKLKIFFDAVNTDPDIPGRLILASKGHKVAGVGGDPFTYIGGVIKDVTGFRVGDVYDTQRRRRDAIPEVYSTRVLA
jgi:hypothetical protein